MTTPSSITKCPWCGEEVISQCFQNLEGPTLLERQLRIVIFDEPRTELSSSRALSVFEEITGRFVFGRAATKAEAEKYSKDKLTGKPYAVGREPHLRICNKWNGKPYQKETRK